MSENTEIKDNTILNDENTAEKEDRLLEVKNLTVEFTSGKQIIHAVNDVSFSLGRGKTLGLVGETGAGKTTIAKSILRILNEYSGRVRSGEIIMDGQNLLELSEKEMMEIRGNKISMIFQDPMTALNPVMQVGEQIAEAIRLHYKVTKVEAKQRAVEMLKMVGITAERADNYPHQFSGGMKQRVVIAMALACRPELLLADEPTTALDVTIQMQVLEMIRDLRKQFNMSMIMITHDFGIVAEVCDDVAVVYAGEIIESGSLEDLFTAPSHPYTIGLFNSIPRLDVKVEKLQPVPGLPPDPARLPEGCHFAPRCPHATDECRAAGKVPFYEVTPGHLCRCYRFKKEGDK